MEMENGLPCRPPKSANQSSKGQQTLTAFLEIHSERKSCPAPYREFERRYLDPLSKIFSKLRFLVASVALPVGQLYFHNAKTTNNTWPIPLFCLLNLSKKE